MLSCTTARLDLLMKGHAGVDQVFHYLPFCFAGSWILLLSCLSRTSLLRLSMDLTRLADDLQAAEPNYCLNVPVLLDRMRSAVEQQLAARGGMIHQIFRKAQACWLAQYHGSSNGGAISLFVARKLIFPAIRKKIGANLKALICGSAPLSLETQLFFMMLGIRVLQVYGLTETTAICTMDHPEQVEPGAVGPPIPGIEMTLGAGDEILVRGPNVFAGYWNRPAATAEAMNDGWFHSGDRGEKTSKGNWRILGRVKNLLVLSSGHNVAPEPLEDALVASLQGAQQVVVFGHGRSHLVALITGAVQSEQARARLDDFNAALPHYRRIRAFHIQEQPLTIESGLLTANGKLRRDAIAAQFRDAIEALYEGSKP
jgi:long-chain acyl-CoA synthetase